MSQKTVIFDPSSNTNLAKQKALKLIDVELNRKNKTLLWQWPLSQPKDSWFPMTNTIKFQLKQISILMANQQFFLKF